MRLLPHQTIANTLIDEGFQGYATGFRERLHMASLKSLTTNRSEVLPTYLSDLGVRAFKDPELFFAANTSLHGYRHDIAEFYEGGQPRWTPLTGVGDVASELRIAGMVDAAAVLLGDYRYATDLLAGVTQLPPTAFVTSMLPTYVGTVLAVAGDERALTYFAKAKSNGALPADRVMADIRRSASLAKRFGQPREAGVLLNKLLPEIAGWVNEQIISEGDGAALSAVTLKLRALTWLEVQSIPRAFDDIMRADELIRSGQLYTVQWSEVARYAAQISVNKGQLHSLTGDESQALRVWLDNVEFCETEETYSLSEALMVAAHGAYACEAFDLAINLSTRAETLLRQEASPVRLQNCRELVVASLHKLGKTEASMAAYQLAQDDQLGFKGIAEVCVWS